MSAQEIVAVDLPTLLAWLAEDRPLLDVRAPVEFAAGAFPAARNLPVLDDSERARVGTCYKREGQAAAIALGHRLVSGATRAARIEGWSAFVRAHPGLALYCWRGGLRSATAQEWLREAGHDVPRVAGGYKAMRQLAMHALDAGWDALAGPALGRMVVLGGRTGSGKTALLRELATTIDLEALAAHRGSSFGRRLAPQPAQPDFEHALLGAIAKHARGGHRVSLFEDESRMIGRVALPTQLHAALKRAPLVVLDVPIEERAAHIEREYVHEAIAEHLGRPGVTAQGALQAVACDLREALGRIERRLGGARHAEIGAALAAAVAAHERGDTRQHAVWITALLRHYYDPMYDYQLGKRTEPVAFRGDRAAVRAYLAAL